LEHFWILENTAAVGEKKFTNAFLGEKNPHQFKQLLHNIMQLISSKLSKTA
jgi:hypothetical protein